MTGPGEGFQDGSPPTPPPAQALDQDQIFTGLSPLGSLDALRSSKSPSNVNAEDSQANNSHGGHDSGGSVFDDDEDEINSVLGDLPEAIPNISDGGTDILQSGRAELREFHDHFLKQAARQKADLDGQAKQPSQDT